MQSTAQNSGWRLFRYVSIWDLMPETCNNWHQRLASHMVVLDEFTLTERSKVWLIAYEHHYREEFFQQYAPIISAVAGQTRATSRFRRSSSAWTT